MKHLTMLLGRLPIPILILAILFPFVSPSPYLTHIAILILIWSSVATAWSYMGRFGMVSLCHGAFVGITAYITAIMFNSYHLTPWIGMLMGLMAVIIVAGVIAYACFRFGVIGHYFAITTLVITELVTLVIIACRDLTGGHLGYTINSLGSSSLHMQLLYLQFAKKAYSYYLALALLLASLYVWRKIDRSKAKKALMAIGDDEVAASSIGIPIVRYKTIIMIISAFMAGLGGVIYAQYIMYLNPNNMVGVVASLGIVFKAILGGMFTLWGPMVGTIMITSLEEYVRLFFGTEYVGWSMIGYGIIIIILILFLPRGLYGTLSDVLSKRRKTIA